MKIFLLASPYDSGHYKKRLGLGSALLMDKASDHLKKSGHAVRTFELSVENDSFPTEVTRSFEVNRSIAVQVKAAKENGEFPLIFAGNCNTAIGILGGLQEPAGVVWFDCHGDFNTPETTVGGFLDGMALAMIAGRCWKPLTASVPGFKPVQEDNILLIGARDFDDDEARSLSSCAMQLITAQQLNQEQLAAHFPPVDSIYLHIDLDVIDPQYVQINSYATEGGLSPEQLYQAVEQIRKRYRISAAGFTAYDPSLDPERKVEGIVNKLISIIVQ